MFYRLSYVSRLPPAWACITGHETDHYALDRLVQNAERSTGPHAPTLGSPSSDGFLYPECNIQCFIRSQSLLLGSQRHYPSWECRHKNPYQPVSSNGGDPDHCPDSATPALPDGTNTLRRAHVTRHKTYPTGVARYASHTHTFAPTGRLCYMYMYMYM